MTCGPLRRAAVVLCLLALALTLTACAPGISPVKGAYTVITPAEAKELMDTASPIILDVRTPEEFAAGHIPGAVNIQDSTLQDLAEGQLPDKAATILVYCRSGRRSRASAEVLADLGYTDVRDFGGILDWPYAVEK